MRLAKTLLALAWVGWMSGSMTLAQDYTTKTLDFDNITSTNVNQTVAEIPTNEKEVEFGDYDNDGDLDVAMAVAQSDFGARNNKLYRNDNGVLNEVSGTVISGFSLADVSRSVYFRDYDNDGLLDIVVINDSNSGAGNNNSPGKTKYFRNDGGTSFVNESNRLNNITGAACNGASEDFDNNGFCDLMMANYPNTTQDSLALNNIGAGVGQFTVVTATNMPSESGGDIPNGYAVHAEAADMNGDGLLDLLVTNRTNEPSYIHYNNNSGAGSGPGDFRYSGTGARTTINDPAGGASENGMFPADFNNDGLMDLYYSNYGTGLSDALFINTGNDAFNRAMFTILPFSASVNGETYKVETSDLDEDGRVDLIVMSASRRPFIFRNTTENGVISFLEWTPGSFTLTHRGWHANAGDVSGSDRPDILVGANDDDFLFENSVNTPLDFDTISGILPAFHNSNPVAVSGEIDGEETLSFVATGLPVGASVSVLVRSLGDLSFTAAIGATSLGGSNNKGDDVDESLQFTVPSSGILLVQLTNEAAAGVLLGDINGDGLVNLLDISGFVTLITAGTFQAEGDMNGDGLVNLLDVSPFVTAVTNGGGGTGGGTASFVFEILSRS